MIRGENLTKVFKRGRSVVNALNSVDFSIDRGEFVCITGRSGCGKTTFLNIIGFLDFPTSGDIYFEGKKIAFSNSEDMTVFRREHVGFVFQKIYLQFHLTVLENILLPLRYSGKNYEEGLKKANELLEILEISNRADFFPNELSGGEAQRVAIARAFINSPELILADEPTSELDTQSSSIIMKLLRETSDKYNVSIVTVTHDPLVLPYGDRVLYMEDGKFIK